MKSTKLLKGALAISSAAMLAACGGGDSAPEVAWASPAVFVTPGAASKAYKLTDCQRDVYNRKTSEWEQEEQPLYKATLVIASNGDMSVVASATENGTPTTVWSKTFAETQQISWSVEGTSPTFTYSLYSYNEQREGGRKSLSVYEDTDDDDSIVGYLEGEDYNSESNTSIDCGMGERLALQVNINEARVAKNLGSAAGVTGFDSYDADGRIEGDNAFWYSDSGSSAYQHWRFNLKTGALASSTSTTGTYSAVSFALPTGASQYGAYGESRQRNNSYFDYKDANIVCLLRDESESGFSLSAAAYGTKFFPQGDRLDDSDQLSALEQPKGGFFFGCGER